VVLVAVAGAEILLFPQPADAHQQARLEDSRNSATIVLAMIRFYISPKSSYNAQPIPDRVQVLGLENPEVTHPGRFCDVAGGQGAAELPCRDARGGGHALRRPQAVVKR
jgi:hypothetical protein